MSHALIDDGAVQLPSCRVWITVEAGPILRHFDPQSAGRCLETFIGILQIARVPHIEQIEAAAQIDIGPDHRGTLDLKMVFRPIERPFRPVLPEVDSMPQPIPDFHAGIQLIGSQQHRLGRFPVAAMIGDHHALVVERIGHRAFIILSICSHATESLPLQPGITSRFRSSCFATFDASHLAVAEALRIPISAVYARLRDTSSFIRLEVRERRPVSRSSRARCPQPALLQGMTCRDPHRFPPPPRGRPERYQGRPRPCRPPSTIRAEAAKSP